MFESVKELIDVPFKIYSFIGYDGAADKIYDMDNPVESFCYPVPKSQSVVDNTGSEVVSNTTLYVDGSNTVLNVLDKVSFQGETKEIKALDSYYAYGKLELWVVYI